MASVCLFICDRLSTRNVAVVMVMVVFKVDIGGDGSGRHW